MTDLKQEARTLTLGERMVLIARLAVLEHLRQSASLVPPNLSANQPDEDGCCKWLDIGGTDSCPEQAAINQSLWNASLTEDTLGTLIFPTRDLPELRGAA
jgi:hypothetical protein